MVTQFLLVIFSFVLAGCATLRSPSSSAASTPPVEINPQFAGRWIATANCEKHPSWPSEISIAPGEKEPQILHVQRGKALAAMNSAGEVVELDNTGVLFRTIRLPQAYNDGNQIVIASIWRNEDPSQPPREPPGIAVILTIYTLKDQNSLIYEKYGYTTEERKNADVWIETYSKSFPKNYHCEFQRKS